MSSTPIIASFDAWYAGLGGAASAYRDLLAIALGPGQVVDQQGFLTADEILDLARRAGARAGYPLLDVCCGPGGPAALLTDRLGCHVVGLDRSPCAVRLARARHGRRAAFVVGEATRLPFGRATFQSALVLESMLSIPCPGALLEELARVIRPGGRLGLTAEVGEPLGPAELGGLPAGLEAHAVPERTLVRGLERAGFRSLDVTDLTTRQARVAHRFLARLADDRAALARELGADAVADLAATIGTVAELLASRRLAKLAIVAERCHE